MMDWYDLAACRDEPHDLFFPNVGDGKTAAVAKSICATCPVAAECLAYAQDIKATGGIWGGTTDKERQKLRRVA